MTEQELIDNYNRLLKENDELKEEINILKAIECPLEKDFLGYMNCEYPKQGPTMPCHDRICEVIKNHEARADERYSELKEANKRLREALQMISNGMDISDHDPLKEQIVGYFRGIAEAALKKGD